MDSSLQFSTYKDCLARRVLAEPDINAPTQPDSHTQDEADALDDFSEYLARETWSALPQRLRDATYEVRETVPDVDDVDLDNIPTAFADTLISCGISDDADAAAAFLRRALKDYVAEACAPPPMWSKTRTTECEICEREVPLTYHHLIPREVHNKVLKKKWHPEAMLNSVAWLCRPCHTAVHHVATNEVLAKEFYTVELLLAREDIQKWRRYAAKQRFGVRRG
ncbi:uncharacterized protein TRAVEDRAFT_40562 [Trametes versicolor FP-101664 SS1]|uniref:uncharacterized protein n=1 Tax=Trametes versicolor (strain FP-101664) TaxID=717944 RepID=UPI0004622A1E|nr:uncharacterized protein TRAVEDRAFT_40562 [Trametes versicolor FP-101664 SS1]EIW53088.1 hypothetical protein TRAVEDRAFT_40562 [Trametes versicolor FP-101664 SS1]